MGKLEQQLNEQFFTNELDQLHQQFDKWAKNRGVKLEKIGDSGGKQGLKLTRDGHGVEVAVQKPEQVKVLPTATLDGVWGLVVKTNLNGAQHHFVAAEGVWRLSRPKAAFVQGPGVAPLPLDDGNRWDQVDNIFVYLEKLAEAEFGMQVGRSG